MSYIINFTDQDNTTPITVFDQTSNTETSLTFPGRQVSGYGKTIAENFLHLLENFANAAAPRNPVEGQLWYDTDNNLLQVYDSVDWKAAGGVQKSPIQPDVSTAQAGELWVDTVNQQLRIFTGTRWLLVGPQQSTVEGLRFGPSVERILDINNVSRDILAFYIADIPIAIFSKDSFVPKTGIDGFSNIKSGVNITTPDAALAEQFEGGNLPKLIGIAASSDALQVGSISVPSSMFLRSDIENVTDFSLTVRNNSGISIGNPSVLRLSTTPTSARIYNSSPGNNLDIQTNQAGSAATVIRVVDSRVGINKLDPDHALDVSGNIRLDGSLLLSNTATNSIQTQGGLVVTRNITAGTGATISGPMLAESIKPIPESVANLGTADDRWTLWSDQIHASEIFVESFTGNVNGVASQATEFVNPVSLSMSGDVTSSTKTFAGGGDSVEFVTEISSGFISARPSIADEPAPPNRRPRNTDELLTFRSDRGLLRQSRRTFIGDLGVPAGAILPYAGQIAPDGYLLCDGSEVERDRYPELFNAIGNLYNGVSPLLGINTFRLPDLRGRFPLGRDNMDNNQTVPAQAGGFVDAGGGSADRVPGVGARVLAGSGGNSEVSIQISNIPDHEHDMRADNRQYFASRVDSSVTASSTAGLGPTAPGAAQYLNTSGNVKKPNPDFTFGNPLNVVNPFLTLNYIIRSGPQAF